MDYHIKGTHNFYLIGFLWIPRKSVSKGNLESAYFIWSCCHVFKFANHGIIFNFGVLSLSSSWYRSYLLKLSWIIMGHIMPNHRWVFTRDMHFNHDNIMGFFFSSNFFLQHQCQGLEGFLTPNWTRFRWVFNRDWGGPVWLHEFQLKREKKTEYHGFRNANCKRPQLVQTIFDYLLSTTKGCLISS